MATFFKFSSSKPADLENQTKTPSSSSSNESCFPSMTLKERLLGFGMCFVLGILIEILSFLSMGGSITKMAILYSLGNIVSLSGTAFLIGFQRQFKNMTNKTRALTATVFLISLILTFVFALVLKNKLLVLICLIVQFASFFWYSLSYIPYGRTIFTKCVGLCLKS